MTQEDIPKFSLSKKTPSERGVTFSVREKPTIGFTHQPKEKIDVPVWKTFFEKPKVELGTWEATAICGNDITSSCLYVAAIAAAYAGAYAPVSLLMVAGVLFLYRRVYAEVGDALPLNGGAYNCLLNTTTKAKASVAACMTLLSYIATAVISAQASAEYLYKVIGGFDPNVVTRIILVLFAALTIIGIGESAKIALGIFLFHLVTLSVLIIGGAWFMIRNPEIFAMNWQLPPPGDASLPKALFLGFSVAMLGVSGFESSANFIEEQKPGVFPKTLRNMWIAVTILNPTIAAVALGTLPFDMIIEGKKALLVNVANASIGDWMGIVIAVDATLVLCGAVLAGYVGSTGLVSRMTLDRCLPQYLLKVNRRGTNHRIIILFLLLCLSILQITGGDIFMLGGIYTISFLGVMSLFACGNILLKVRRAKLPRKIRANWPTVLVALFCTIAGIYGNVRLEPEYLKYFAFYFFPTVGIVLFTLYRHHIFSFFLLIIGETMRSLEMSHQRVRENVMKRIKDLKSQGVIFFTKGDDVASLNRAMLYVQENEISNKITVIHVLGGMKEPPPRLVTDLKLLDEIYPELNIELVIREGSFGPKLIQELSEKYRIPPNYMFVGTPGDNFPHQISELGGVRVII